jgi:hypothetical protein
MHHFGLGLPDILALLVDGRKYLHYWLVLCLQQGLGGYPKQCFGGPLCQPVELAVFGDGGVAEQVFSELLGFGVEHEHYLQLLLQVVGKVKHGVLFADCYVVLDELVLEQIGQLLEIGLGVGHRHEGSLEQDVQLFLLAGLCELELLDQQERGALVDQGLFGGSADALVPVLLVVAVGHAVYLAVDQVAAQLKKHFLAAFGETDQ